MDQIATKIAARKNQAERARLALSEPKKTMAPEKAAKSPTVMSKMLISCMILLVVIIIP